ncbi:FUSC family protein [Bradyrhizobium genosp. P]|uniref:FUSC family protein n=1 Tax=Bradyrhizobium genosp. P TaxID=83641 RepID=UPI003CF90D46
MSARHDNSVIATFISDGVTDQEVSKPMLSGRSSKLKAFVKLAGGRLTTASPFVLYGLRLSASVVLALFVPYRLELDSGFWAGITAAVVCQPSLGSSLRKARVRAVGTIFGAIAILLLTSAFPQNRLGLLVGLALWIGVCGFFATILRHFASYGAALAGFTAAVIFADVIDAPGETFIVAATRMSEICIGVVAVAVVVMLTSVGDGRRQLAENLARVAQQTAAGLADTLAIGPDTVALLSRRRSLIRSVVALQAVIEEAKAEEPQLRHRSEILQAGMESLFSALSAWQGIANHFNKAWDDLGRRDSASLRGMVLDATAVSWIDGAERVREACGEAARRVLTVPVDDVATRLLVDSVAEALLDLQRVANSLVLVVAPGKEMPDVGGGHNWFFAPDLLPAAVNGLRAVVIILATEVFWVQTGWSGGQAVVTFAAVSVTVFSPDADLAYRSAIGYSTGTILAAALAVFVNFAILPAQEGFTDLSLTLTCVLVPLGALAAGPWQKALTAGLIINFLAILLPSNQPNYNDLGQFLNSAFAVIAGTIAAATAMRLFPPISPTWRARRLVALTARDLCAMAVAVRWPSRSEWVSRVCWRLQAMPEEAAPEQLAQLELALSIGEALIYLRNSRLRLSGRTALDQAFASLAAADQPAVSASLSDFSTQQIQGAPLVAMRSRAAATLIVDALSRRVGFLDTTKKLQWH